MPISSYEKIIIDILKKENISFVKEKSYDDCGRGYYRYDFYLPDRNVLVECDGQQHFLNVKKFYKNRTDFLKTKERDRKKNAYALAHDIKLYRIPFWEMDALSKSDDIFQKKFLVTSIYHNDNLKIPKSPHSK